jgi:hypothetical protein
MERRDFVRNLFISATAFSVGPYLRPFGHSRSAAVGKEGWSGTAFEGVFGTSFRVRSPHGFQRMVLDQVAHGRRKNLESASLRFRGKAQLQLSEGTYSFLHPDLGRMDLFIVPGTAAGGDCFYRATLCRLV